MKKTQVFNNLNKTIPFGFIYSDPEPTGLTFEDIFIDVQSSIMIYDTSGSVLKGFLAVAAKHINNKQVVIAGITSAQMLKDLKSNGIVNGFYRSTEKNSKVSVIIIDKKKAYIVVNRDLIFQAKDAKSSEEIFQYMNHILWTQTDFEVINNQEPSKITQQRLSIVKPGFTVLLHKDKLIDKNMKYATNDFPNKETVLLKEAKDSELPAMIISSDIKSMIITDKTGYINIFEDVYAPIIVDITQLIIAQSFSELRVDQLINKSLWYDGKDRVIEPKLIVEKTIYQPIDTYKNYTPDFNSILNSEVKGLYGEVYVQVDVLPLKIDDSFKMSPRYKKKSEVQTQLQDNLDRLIKLVDDDKKEEVKDIIQTTILIERLQKYNAYITSTSVGLEQLNNKKNPFKTIQINTSEISVPHELIGTLYIKDNQNYFAVEDENKISSANEWLKENKLSAALVKKNG